LVCENILTCIVDEDFNRKYVSPYPDAEKVIDEDFSSDDSLLAACFEEYGDDNLPIGPDRIPESEGDFYYDLDEILCMHGHRLIHDDHRLDMSGLRGLLTWFRLSWQDPDSCKYTIKREILQVCISIYKSTRDCKVMNVELVI